MHFDSLFETHSQNDVSKEIYRSRISNEEGQRVVEISNNEITTYAIADNIEGFYRKREYDLELRSSFLMLIDSTFWAEKIIDNTSKINDGAILEIEGLRDGQYQKLRRKAWSQDIGISTLQGFFEFY